MAPRKKTSLVDDAFERLKAEILQARMPPGFQATEPEIAERLGMSRTPVREALIKLEAIGLVELIPRRGARVLPILPEDMHEIYEILTSLEPEAAARIARGRPSAEDLRGLDEATEDMERALEREDLDAWAEADDRFHRTLLELGGNRRLTAFVTSLFDQAHRSRLFTLRLRARPVQSTLDHRAIVTHMLAGDAEKTRDCFRAHRERAAAELVAILDRYRLPQL